MKLKNKIKTEKKDIKEKGMKRKSKTQYLK